MGEIWAIILAAGESKRMKTPKMLLTFNGMAMIEKVIENVTNSGINKTMVVTGAYKEEILKVIEHLSVMQCYNENYRQGMLSSVKCGFRSVPSEAEAVVVFPGDQPGINSGIINLIIESYRKTKKGIVIPVCNEKRGHPVLIDIKYRDEVVKIDPEDGLRSLSYRFPEDVLEVETSNSAVLKDIDTYEEYMNEINQIQ
jgi:molybdenum cofactor cytidylyltransferase